MQQQTRMRRNVALHFVTIGVGTVLILLAAIVWLSLRVDQQAFSHIVLLIGSAMFAIVGLVAWVAKKFDATFVQPDIDQLNERGKTKRRARETLVDN